MEARRTVAMRPGGAVLTPPSAPASTPCLNCGSNIQSNFCPECGQRAGDPNPTLREFLHALAEEFLHWDGKLGATLALLFRKPGLLTTDYLAGRRVRYVAPMRLYLTASVLYFFAIAVLPVSRDEPMVQITRTKGPANAAHDTLTSGVRTPTRSVDSAKARSSSVNVQLAVRMRDGELRAANNVGVFTARVRSQLATVVFVILPAFAFAVGLVYRKERRHYPQHVVFALHVHCVAFLMLTAAALFRATDNANVERGAEIVGLALLVAYLMIALRRVYGGSWGVTVGKTALLSLVYTVFFAAGVGTIVVFDLVTF